MTSPYATLAVLLLAIIGAYAGLMFKLGAKKFTIKNAIKNYKVMLGCLLYGISAVGFIIALKFGDLVTLFPLTSTTYIWTAIFSVKVLGERMNKYKIAGITIIIIGAALIVQ